MSEKRGDLRIIYSDDASFAQREMNGQVFAVVGPIGEHTSHPDLQDALGYVAMQFNKQHGRLSEAKHMELAKRLGQDGLSLLRTALESAEKARTDSVITA